MPPSARWSFLRSHAKQPTIGKTVDDAMDAIERENPTLRDVLPKVFARGNLDHLINRRTKKFTAEDIQRIADTYHQWRTPKGNYEDVKGFCSSTTVDRVKELDYVLTPGRHVGLPDEEEDFDFKERFGALKAVFDA